jgi:cytochrome P450
VTHRHPRYWRHPDGFDPDRFTDERSAGRHKYAYFPFAGGPRQCIGNHFAMVEATVVLARLAREFEVELVPGHQIELEPVITLRPRTGVRATIRRRAAEQ